MDCRRFRDQHALLIDVRCSALEESEMRQHMSDCPACAHHDALVRRSLMLVRSLPTIEPSPDFRARLEARLRATQQEPAVRRPMQLTFGTFVAVAATVAFAAFLATAVRDDRAPEIQMPPVVASVPADDAPSHFASSALVAAVPTGMSVWPAIMAATQAPIHFVAAEMAAER
jgi:anti-sigma factor RsiW